MEDMLVHKSKSISLLWELRSVFMNNLKIIVCLKLYWLLSYLTLKVLY